MSPSCKRRGLDSNDHLVQPKVVAGSRLEVCSIGFVLSVIEAREARTRRPLRICCLSVQHLLHKVSMLDEMMGAHGWRNSLSGMGSAPGSGVHLCQHVQGGYEFPLLKSLSSAQCPGHSPLARDSTIPLCYRLSSHLQTCTGSMGSHA